MSQQRYTLLIALLFLTMLSCKKDDESDNIGKEVIYTVSGNVIHHEALIPYSTLFLKYGANEFPGRDTSLYDLRVQSDSSAKYKFTLLKAGTHYLFARGYDPAINDSVYGGIPIELKESSPSKEIDVPVTE